MLNGRLKAAARAVETGLLIGEEVYVLGRRRFSRREGYRGETYEHGKTPVLIDGGGGRRLRRLWRKRRRGSAVRALPRL